MQRYGFFHHASKMMGLELAACKRGTAWFCWKMRIILSKFSRGALKWSRLNHCLVVFDGESGSCRLAAGCSGL